MAEEQKDKEQSKGEPQDKEKVEVKEGPKPAEEKPAEKESPKPVEEKPAEKESPKPVEEKPAKKESPKPAEEKVEQKVPESKPAEKKGATAEAKKERPANCASCNNAFKYKKWYYRNGKYFCNKKCWKKFNTEKKKGKEATEKPASPKESS